MPAKPKVFWGIVIAFILAVTVYSAYAFRSHQVAAINYADKNEEFAKNGVPNFALPVLAPETGAPTGENLKLENVQDGVLIVNFWASWCAPCQTEFPQLVDLAEKYKDRPGMKILAVSVDHDMQALSQFLTTFKKPYPANFIILSDPDGNIAGRYGTHKLPETYIINREHKLVRKVISEQDWNSPGFMKFLDSIMGNQK